MTVLEQTSPLQSTSKPSLFAPLENLNFRLLWAGQSISLFGDQFYLVALPWLTYRMTGSGLALGMVLMAAGIPRALLMIFGGLWSDRIQPRWIMLGSNLLRFGLTAILTVLILAGQVQLWMLFVISFLFGSVDAFFLPAQMSMIPSLVKAEQIQASNALFQMTAQLSQFVGPALAGLLISVLGGSGKAIAGQSPSGLGTAIGIDTLTFLAAVATLWMMRSAKTPLIRKSGAQSALAALQEGLLVVAKDPLMVGIILVTCLVNLTFAGPLAVGIPALAATRFSQGAAALGTIISALGAGSLTGAGLAGALHPKHPGIFSLWTILVAGCGFASLGLIQNLAVAAGVTLVIGIGVGYTNVLLISSLQKRTAPELRGRVMSLTLFGSMGISPISNALAGGLVDVNLAGLFLGAGALLVAMGVIAMALPQVRKLCAQLA